MPPLNRDRYPRLSSYLAGLPRGLESYPECQARASLCNNLLHAMPAPRPSTGEVPEPLSSLLSRRWTGLWIPEVHLMAVSLTIADHYGFDDESYLRWVRDANRGYFNSIVVRVLMAFVSPADLMGRAGARWSAIHKGTTLSASLVGPGLARAELVFPQGLFSPILLQHFRSVWQAVIEHANATDCRVDMVEATDTHAVYQATWS